MFDLKKQSEEMFSYIREGEECSCPYIVKKDGAYMAGLFTYFTARDVDLVIYNLGRNLMNNGEQVLEYEVDIFTSEDDFIHIHDEKMKTLAERNALYEEYYNSVDKYIMEKNQKNRERVKENFLNLIPLEVIELYKRVCPEFVMEFGLNFD